MMMVQPSENIKGIFLAALLTMIMPLSLGCWVLNTAFDTYYGPASDWKPISPIRWLMSALVPLLFVVRAMQRGSLSKSGVIAGLLVGIVMMISSFCFFVSMAVFFLVGSRATVFRSARKRRMDDAFKEGGQRDWVQVICNGGVATELAILYIIDHGCSETIIDFAHDYNASWLSVGVLGALACCCGDTLASELGTVIGNSHPRLITTLECVPTGTNGAVSVVGLLASALGGFIVAVGYYAAELLMLPRDLVAASCPQWPLLIVGTIAGLLGSVIDSLLGATCQFSGYCTVRQCMVERPGDSVHHVSGCPLLDNHSVNLLSSLLTALVTPVIAFHVWSFFA
ncbi:PREDICTED: transmembrane protein 19-like [Priapulus caudatus]|uniref:Transmembrane protein 19 n=1 Tax=Priapulus caudatus TaxID=37621 RepID=A0ABM1E3L3_PRICU|nr:PREDICTED: transmembrane protein 19-like [Priapulus caudatus]